MGEVSWQGLGGASLAEATLCWGLGTRAGGAKAAPTHPHGTLREMDPWELVSPEQEVAERCGASWQLASHPAGLAALVGPLHMQWALTRGLKGAS